VRARETYARLLALPGLAVMVVAAVIASRYTPFWFDLSETCLNRDPCFSEVESAAVLRSTSWIAWAGLLLVVLSVGLTARAQSSAQRSSPSGSGAAIHAGVSGLVAGPAAAAGLALALAGTLVSRLGWAVVVIAWLGLAALLETLDLSLGRQRGARAAYLLSLGAALVGLVALGGTLAVAGLGPAQIVGGVILSSLAVAVVTALGDVVQDRHFKPWAGRTAAAITAIFVLGAGAGGLGLLVPQKVWPAGTWSSPNAHVPPLAPALPRPAAPTAPAAPGPTQKPTSVSARQPCSPGDLTMTLDGFDAAMGARAASVMVSNQGESACYLDGFATVRLLQGGQPLKLRIGTTSSEQPGMAFDGHATRVGIAPGHAARASLYWRGYGNAADQKTPQSLEVRLRPGVAAVPLEVTGPLFDLIDGGELRVGNWLPAA